MIINIGKRVNVSGMIKMEMGKYNIKRLFSNITYNLVKLFALSTGIYQHSFFAPFQNIHRGIIVSFYHP